KLARLKPIKRPAFTKRKRNAEERVADALSNVPRITNETVAEHREDVLKAARKYIYPLEHSRHRVVRITIVLLVLAVVIFFGYCGAALYKFQSTNGFIYGVTRVIPFPVAKSGPRWISYESYLFELRRNMHYYETQQQSDFATRDGKVQLKRLKQQALTQVTQDAYVKQLAEKNKVSVSQQSVDNQVSLVRSQNRLGSNDRVFKDVLNQFWGWSIDDFKRELRGELLQQAVVAKLDSATQTRADAALQQLKDGGDFAAIATASSEDPTTVAAGGQYPNAVTPTDRDIAPQVTAALFRLQPGQTSGLVSTGYTLEIVKVIDREGTSLHGAHIQFNYQPITTYTKPLAAKQKLHTLVKP
ncbi:MAG: peptidylprolyl isomerase, partial [Candidatus Saccharimonadales bacterium]